LVDRFKIVPRGGTNGPEPAARIAIVVPGRSVTHDSAWIDDRSARTIPFSA
jgi:hypothetical protein